MSFKPIEVPVVDQTAAPGFTPIERDVPAPPAAVERPKRRSRPADATVTVEKQES